MEITRLYKALVIKWKALHDTFLIHGFMSQNVTHAVIQSV